MAERYIFPAVFYPPGAERLAYCVVYPDLDVATQGDNLAEALDMAKELLELTLYGLEEDGLPVPRPSAPRDIMLEDPGAFVSLVSVYMPSVRAEMAHQFVRKTVTIPKWLDDIAQSAGINFSRELRSILTLKLGVAGPPGMPRAFAAREEPAVYGEEKPRATNPGKGTPPGPGGNIT